MPNDNHTTRKETGSITQHIYKFAMLTAGLVTIRTPNRSC